jgi:hypothetical protein
MWTEKSNSHVEHEGVICYLDSYGKFVNGDTKMRKNIFILFAAVLTTALSFTACELLGGSGGGGGLGINSVDLALRGTWTTYDQNLAAGYKGILEIGYNSIVISGYPGTSASLPFNGYSKSPSSHQAYSEKNAQQPVGIVSPSYEGILHIANAGYWKEIPFTYAREGVYPAPYEYFLTLKFGNTTQKLIKTAE